MTETEILAKIESATKGANINVAWNRPCKIYKKFEKAGIEVRKATRMVMRMGIDYNNMKLVKQFREAGQLPDIEQPIWKGAGEWVTFPYLLRHVKKDTRYLRLYKGTSKDVRPIVQFFLNGEPCNRSDVEQYLTSAEDRSETAPLCISPKIENITSIDWTPATPEIERDSEREQTEETAETEKVSG